MQPVSSAVERTVGVPSGRYKDNKTSSIIAMSPLQRNGQLLQPPLLCSDGRDIVGFGSWADDCGISEEGCMRSKLAVCR